MIDLMMRSLLVMGAGCLVWWMMRRRSAAARHAVISACFVALMFLPFTLLIRPRWSLIAEQPMEGGATALAPIDETGLMAAGQEKRGVGDEVHHGRVPSRRVQLNLDDVVVWGALAGIGWLSVRRAWAIRHLRGWVKRAVAITDGRLSRLIGDARRLTGVRVEVFESRECGVPLVFGWRRPVVLLPEAVSGWSDGTVRSVLLHEMEHVRRKDCLNRLIADLVCYVFWLNPLVWVGARMMRLSQEEACDDAVLRQDVVAEVYAEHLMEVASVLNGQQTPILHVPAMAQTSSLARRVEAILDGGRDRRPCGVRGVIGAVSISVSMMGLSAIAQVQATGDAFDMAQRRGLTFLANRSNPDGSIGGDPNKRSVGTTSLAGMALMTDRKHDEVVRGALGFVMKSQEADGYFRSQSGSMYDHAFATMFLVEGMRCGLAPEGVRGALQRSVGVIQRSQDPEGGWRYAPRPSGSDASVTPCVVLALIAVQRSGLDVPLGVMERAEEFLRRCQNPDGGFRYQAIGTGQSAFARSAASAAALSALKADTRGGFDDALADQYLDGFMPAGERSSVDIPFFIHGQFFLERMVRERSVPWAQRWRSSVRTRLLAEQVANGSWEDKSSVEVATSEACLILSGGRDPR